MIRPLIVLLGILALGVIGPVGGEAATLALYDDFSGGQINATKWQDREIVREIRGGRVALALRQGTYPHYPATFLQFVNPGSIQSIRADARLTAYTPPPGGSSRVRLRGNYYNDGTTGAGATGDVRAQLYLRGTSSGVDIRYDVYKCADSDCDTTMIVVPSTTVKTAALGETHTLRIGWNGAVFTFSVDGTDTVVNPADCATYPTCQAVMNPTPNVIEKNLSSQLLIGAAGGEGYVAGDFDNVYVNDVLYDNFDGAPLSGPRLDPAKWANLELVQEIQSGKFLSVAAGTGALNTTFTSHLRPVNQNLVTALRADVAVTAFHSTNSSAQVRVLHGAFYNDGASTGPSDETGNVYAQIRAHSNNTGPLTVRFSVWRCSNAQCTTDTSLVNDDFATVHVNETHTLFLAWDGSVFTYGAQDLAISKTYDPRSVAPVIKPPSAHSKELRSRVNINQAGAYGYIAATYDNVYVNSEAVLPPRLAPFLQQTVTGDVVSAGVGLRGTGAGTINLTGIPAGATIQKAYLYWATLGSSGAFTTSTLNGTAVTGTLIGQSDDPGWCTLQSYAYRADVTSRITGNGSYTIAGLPTGPVPPANLTTNDSQGASLVVLYSLTGMPSRRIVINDGAVTLRGPYQHYATALTGFTAPTPPTGAKLTFVVGDGQTHTPDYAGLNTTLLATNDFSGSNGAYWDTRSYDVASAIAGGATSARAVLSMGGDSLVWVAAILSVPVYAPPVITGLTATPASPQALGTPITVTAAVTGGAAPYTCKWWVTTDNWATYSRLRDWGTCSLPWTPTVAGSYALGVWVRNNGTTADVSEASQTLAFTVTPRQTTVTLSAGSPSPQLAGTALTFTATGATGTAPYTYKWWVTTDNWQTWALLRDWGGATFTWTPATPGSYQVGVWVRSSGNTTDAPEATAGLAMTITPRQTTVTLSAGSPSPQLAGTALTFTATGATGTAPYTYKWWVTTDNWQTWALLRDWGGATFTWTPATPGSYQVGVWVRSSGNTTDAPEATAGLAMTITPRQTTVTLSAGSPSPQLAGTALTFTATGATGTAPYTYKWWVTTDNWQTWALLRDWGGATFTWTPATPGSYQVGVWVRSSGNTTDAPEATAGLAMTITPRQTTVTLSAGSPSPQLAGTALTFTATGATGTAPYTYKWWVTTDNWQTWALLRDWGGATFTWTPATPGSYQVGVWVRSSGNTTDAPEATAGLAMTITPRQTTVTLSAGSPSPQLAGTALTFTATGATGTAPYTYKWWVTTDNWQTWALLRDWGGATFTWTPTTPGSYQVGVWVRSSGNTTDAPEATAGVAMSITGLPVTVTATPAAPQRVGTSITLTAAVSGGTAPQACKWWLTTDNWATSSLLRDWQACSTALSWTPTTPGSYQVGAWARGSGVTADAPQGNAGLAVTITPLPVTVTATPAAPQRVGTPITLTATVSGGTAPQACKWWLTTDNWATSSLLRDWQACSTALSWTPTTPGSYQVGAWARGSGVTADAPQGNAGLAYAITPVVPDLRGTYSGSGSATNSNCTDSSDNGPVSLSGNLTIPSQAGGNFSGSLSVVACSSEGCEPDTLTLSGTITATGQVSGTLVDAEGSYSYTGSLSGNTLTVHFAGAWRDNLGGCNLSGSFNGTRP